MVVAGDYVYILVCHYPGNHDSDLCTAMAAMLLDIMFLAVALGCGGGVDVDFDSVFVLWFGGGKLSEIQSVQYNAQSHA